MKDIDTAILSLRENEIAVTERAYGFSLGHKDVKHRDFAQCGMDNDSSISMSVEIDEDPPVVWFFRTNFTEMAAFIIQAYKKTKKTDPNRADIVNAMRHLNQDYDDATLTEMTDAFLENLEHE